MWLLGLVLVVRVRSSALEDTSGISAMLGRVLNPAVAKNIKLTRIDPSACPDAMVACGAVADGRDGTLLLTGRLVYTFTHACMLIQNH